MFAVEGQRKRFKLVNELAGFTRILDALLKRIQLLLGIWLTLRIQNPPENRRIDSDPIPSPGHRIIGGNLEILGHIWILRVRSTVHHPLKNLQIQPCLLTQQSHRRSLTQRRLRLAGKVWLPKTTFGREGMNRLQAYIYISMNLCKQYLFFNKLAYKNCTFYLSFVYSLWVPTYTYTYCII